MEHGKYLILDTDFIIELLSTNPAALDYVTENKVIPYISVITTAELIRGAKNKIHLTRILKELSLFTPIALDSDVSATFEKLMVQYALSHQIGISDALIAATAITYDMPLLTCNTRHFTFIEGLYLPPHDVKPVKKGF